MYTIPEVSATALPKKPPASSSSVIIIPFKKVRTKALMARPKVKLVKVSVGKKPYLVLSMKLSAPR